MCLISNINYLMIKQFIEIGMVKITNINRKNRVQKSRHAPNFKLNFR
jgi:hypothetical protein